MIFSVPRHRRLGVALAAGLLIGTVPAAGIATAASRSGSTDAAASIEPEAVPTAAGSEAAATTPGSPMASDGADPVGDWSATPISPPISWAVDQASGAFRLQHPLRTPPVASGEGPALSVDYDSGTVDGKGSSRTDQASWVGEGFELGGTGFIERRYRTCAADGVRGRGDLCWAGDNARISFGRWSGELVRADGRTGPGASVWRIRDDAGARLERRTSGANSDNDREFWILTTPDGTQYHFGQGLAGATRLDSAWTVPVFGDDRGEPCHRSSFAASSCPQAWRWNLDRIVTPAGDVTTFQYASEVNRYRRNASRSTVATYVRGGHLAQIRYGLKADSLNAVAPARILFGTEERCLRTRSFTCAPRALTARTASRWPDVPFDRICVAAPCGATQTAPTFFTRRRLAQVTTQTFDGRAYVPTDRWVLTHSFPDPRDRTSPALWLRSIRHTGLAGRTAITLPPNEFVPTSRPNRVARASGAAFTRFRLGRIDTEIGSTVNVFYTEPQCTPTRPPSNEATNTQLCFPRSVARPGAATSTQYFHKYLVTGVRAVDDSLSGSRDLATSYAYLGAPAWAFDDSPSLRPADRHWSLWRGYPQARAVEGDGDTPQLTTLTTWFRGMDGDPTSRTGPGTRAVDVEDSTGTVTPDHRRLAGLPREVQTFDSAGRRLATRITSYRTDAVAGSGGLVATAAPVTEELERRFLGGGAFFETRRDHGYNDDRMRVTTETTTRKVDDGGSTSQREVTCVASAYAVDRSRWILDRVAERSQTAGRCADADAPQRSLSRTYFDGSTILGELPAAGAGRPTRQVDGFGGAIARTDTTYDRFGRVTGTMIAGDVATASTTSYGDDARVPGALARTITASSPDPDGAAGPATPLETVTTIDRRTGDILALRKDNGSASGSVTAAAYDALGRRTAVWQPGRRTDEPASTTYAYAVRATGVSAITTGTLLASGGRRTSVEIHDGLARVRQRQVEERADGSTVTRIDDTTYNSRGLPSEVLEDVVVTGAPRPERIAINLGGVSRKTDHAYDSLLRPVRRVLSGRNASTGNDLRELSRTSTTYVDDTVTTTVTGDVATRTTLDPLGRVRFVDRLPEGTGPGALQLRTAYVYDPVGGGLTSVTDPDGAERSILHDELGRVVDETDPTRGRTRTSYDERGQVVEVVRGAGDTRSVRTTRYDDLGRPKVAFDGEVDSGVRAYEWTYDAATNGKGLPAQTRTYRDGTLVHIEEVTEYDAAGRPTAIENRFSEVAGLLPAALAQPYTQRITYDAVGQVYSRAVSPVGDLTNETTYTGRDALGRDYSLSAGSRGVYASKVLYTPLGQVHRLEIGNSAGKDLYVDHDYDSATSKLLTTTIYREQNLATPIIDSRRTTSYDQVGRASSIKDVTPGGTDLQCFERDEVGNLAKAWTPASSCDPATFATVALGGPAPYRLEWGYDARNGNLRSQTDTSGAELVRDDYAYEDAASPRHPTSLTRTEGAVVGAARTVEHDSRGHLVRRGNERLSWDADDRLIGVVRDGDPVQTAVFAPDGRRLLRTSAASGRTTVYYPDGTQASAATDGSSANVDAERYYSLAGRVVGHRGGSSSDSFTSLVTDDQGTVQFSYHSTSGELTPQRWTPFGTRRGADATPGDLGFLGGIENAEIGLVQVGARTYDPSQGRFLP